MFRLALFLLTLYRVVCLEMNEMNDCFILCVYVRVIMGDSKI